MADNNSDMSLASLLNYDSTGSTYNSSPEFTSPSPGIESTHHQQIFQFNDMVQYPTNNMQLNDPNLTYNTSPAPYSGNMYDQLYGSYGRNTGNPYYYNTGTQFVRGGVRKAKNCYNSRFPYLPNYSKNMRRSETINIAFAAVRGCIPNVSEDTKLSKIQTLRLAISYIRFLMSCLGDYRFMMLMNDQERELYKDFFEKDKLREKKENEDEEQTNNELVDKEKNKPRTRWPQLVWQTSLKTCR